MTSRKGDVATNVESNILIVRLTPKSTLFWNAFWSVVLVALPLLGLLLFLGLGNGSWPVAIAAAVVSAGLCLIGHSLYRSTYIGVTTTTIEERGFWGSTTTLPRSAIASIALVSTYTRASPEPVPQLIVRSDNGSRMLRMRGTYWTLDAMRSVVVALDASASLPIEAMAARDFFGRYPGAAYWYERNRALLVILVIAAVAVGAAAILGIMRVLGLPIDAL